MTSGGVSIDPGDPVAVAAFVRGQGRGVVATVSAAGAPEAALVGFAALDDGTLVFDSPLETRTIANIRHDPRVAVVVGTDADISLQIEGVATITQGRARDHFGAAYNSQHPGSRALEADFAVVVVRPDWVRAYDASVHPAEVVDARW